MEVSEVFEQYKENLGNYLNDRPFDSNLMESVESHIEIDDTDDFRRSLASCVFSSHQEFHWSHVPRLAKALDAYVGQSNQTPMDSLFGEVEMYDTGQLEPIEDLLWYDGPLLSSFKLGEDVYLMNWCDTDDFKTNRWMLVKVAESVPSLLKEGKLTLRDALLEGPEATVRIIDISTQEIESGQLEHTSVVVAKEDIPDDYIPVPDSLIV